MKPRKVTEVELAFGGDIKQLIPCMEQIPDKFKTPEEKWNLVAADWLFGGLKGSKWTPKDGINEKDALRHIRAVLVSHEPKHEHKMAGCAYLMDQFFLDVKYRK